ACQLTLGRFSHFAPSWPQPSPAERPVARTNAAYSARVTSYLPNANGRSETACCGASSATAIISAPWLTAQAFSSMDEPLVNRPAGITTISGQSGQSRNPAPGARSDFLLCSCTSRTASTTVSGSSNCTYSELCRVKICRAFEERSSQRACACAI